MYLSKQTTALEERDVSALQKQHQQLGELSHKHAVEHAKTVEQYEREEFEREYVAKDAY